jgi:signal transduction histidine kinase/CheY-like chemotaxis protein
MTSSDSGTKSRPSVWVYLLLTLGVFSAIPVALLGNLVADARGRDARMTFDQRGRGLADNVVDATTSLLRLKAEVLTVIAGTVESMEDPSPGRLRRVLAAQHGASGSFDAIYIGDAEGRSIVIVPSRTASGRRLRAGVDYGDRDYVIEVQQTHQVSFSKVQKGRQSGVANVMIAAPYYRPSDTAEQEIEFSGVVGAGVRLDLIEDLTARIMGTDDSFRTVILDGSGNLLVDSQGVLPRLVGLPGGTVFGEECGPSTLVGPDDLGVPVRAICAPLELGSQRWSVWVSAPVSSLAFDETVARNATLQASVLSLLVAFVVSLFIVWRTREAFARVQQVALRVAQGDFSVRLPELRRATPREFVDLASVLEQTIRRLEVGEAQNRTLLEQLQEVNARQAPLAAVWSQIYDSVELLDPEGRIQYVNPAHEALLGVVAEEVQGRLSGLFSGEDSVIEGTPLSMNDSLELLATGEMLSLAVARQVDDHELFLGVTVSPVLGPGGALEQIAVVRRDLTSIRMSQQAVAHRERLVSVGTVAAGLAHEINNPLTYVKNGLEELVEDARGLDTGLSQRERIELANDALHGVGRVETIVRSMLQLSRPGDAAPVAAREPVDLSEVVASAVALAEPKLREQAQLHVDLSDNLTARGRPNELVQVLLNLLINAGQAMPPGEKNKRYIKVTAGHSPDGRWVYIDVNDNGRGIGKEQLARVFDPFFTTKDVGEGTGLGLSISHSIACAHGGSLEVCASPDDDTVFRLTLPWVDTQSAASPPAPDALESRPILLVDDDILVGRSLARMLGKGRVYVAQSVDDAVSLIEKHNGFDVILSDVMMPNRSGVDLYHYLSEHHAALAERIVFMTGGTGEGDLHRQLVDTGRPLLRKPVSRVDLTRSLAPFLRS